MSKEDNRAFIKMHFTAFGVDILERFKRHYDIKGLSFFTTSNEKLFLKLKEEYAKLENEVRNKEALLSCIITSVNLLFMLYIKAKENK